MVDNRVLMGRYEVHRLLGRGGMAEVHQGLDQRLGRRVAVKLLRSDLARDPSFHARLKREAQSAASLNHPAIVQVFDSGEEQMQETGGDFVQVPFIIMEYVEGQTLRDILQQHGHLTVRESLDVTAGVLAPLQHSHQQGIVHRDIKPANVMLTPDGDVKVMDFGIARAIADNSSVTQTQTVVGTAQYLSPEQARGEVVDARTDLYSTACLLYELLTGRPPFVGDSPVAIAYQHVGEIPAPPSTYNSEVPESVDRLVMHGLEKNREVRYQDAFTFREDVLAARDGRPLSIDTEATRAVPYSALAAGGAAAGGAYAAGDDATQAMAQPAGDEVGPDTANFQQVMQRSGDEEDAPKRKSRKGWLVAGSILVIAALAALGIFVYNLNRPPEVVTFELADLRDRDANEAEDFLLNQGLLVNREDQADDEISEGRVVSTDPASGTSVSAGQTITVFVSTGPDTVEVPDVEGETESRARQLIGDSSLVAGSNIEENSPDVERGNVIETRPGSGEEVDANSTVDLVISTGLVEVPDVTGAADEDEACGLLEADDTQLTCEVQEEETSDAEPGTILEQSTPGGETVEQGSTITITVARAEPTPSPTPTPSESPEPSPSQSPEEENNGDNGDNGDLPPIEDFNPFEDLSRRL